MEVVAVDKIQFTCILCKSERVYKLLPEKNTFMIDEILDAVLNECKALLTDTGGTVLFKTNYKPANLPNYTMPLILCDLYESEDAKQLLGGASLLDWMFALNSYNYEPDAYVSEETGYSTSLTKVIDDVRRHFSKGDWLTTDMTGIVEKYGFKFTLSGILPADALDQDGLVFGKRIVFDSVSIDTDTSFVQPSNDPLEKVEQVGWPPNS
jgi:hypothetical protein